MHASKYILAQPKQKFKLNPAKQIQELTSDLTWGEKIPGGVRFVNLKETLLRFYNDINSQGYATHQPKKLSQKKINEHMRGEATYYFSGAWRAKQKQTLVMVDIDVNKSQGKGSPAGAKQFAAHLKTLFPGIYFEASTNGKGQHGYMIVDKMDTGHQFTNDSLAHLERYLRAVAAATQADIELVEIKGRLPVFTWEGKRLANLTLGTLAKLPRGEQALQTYQTDVMALRRLKLPEIHQEQSQEQQAKPAPKLKLATPGSLLPISQGELDQLPQLRALAGWLQPQTTWEAKGRVVVTQEDLAIFCLCLHHFTLNPNPDGSLPHARFKGLWQALYNCGLIERGWDNHRFAAIRDGFSRLGLILWEDNTYHYGFQGQKGQACKWKGSELFMELVEKGEAILVGTDPLEPNLEDWLYPVKVFKLYEDPEKAYLKFEWHPGLTYLEEQIAM